MRGKAAEMARAYEALRAFDARLCAAAMGEPNTRKASAGLRVDEREGKTSLV